eukprot:s206_g31.t1
MQVEVVRTVAAELTLRCAKPWQSVLAQPIASPHSGSELVSDHARPMADPAPVADPCWAPVAPGRPAENVGQRGLADGPPASKFAKEVRKPISGR